MQWSKSTLRTSRGETDEQAGGMCEVVGEIAKLYPHGILALA